MELSRRKLLQIAGGTAIFPAGGRGAQAQAYPARLVRLIVGFPPGSSADIVAG